MRIVVSVKDKRLNLFPCVSTTLQVRIPINVSGEVPSFGVYAVPGLATHVFIGPFTRKANERSSLPLRSKDNEVICLDGDDEDDVQVLPNPRTSISQATAHKTVGHRRKQQLHERVHMEDDFGKPQYIPEQKDRTCATLEPARATKTNRDILAGQMPQRVQQTSRNCNDIVVIDDDAGDGGGPSAMSQRERMHKQLPAIADHSQGEDPRPVGQEVSGGETMVLKSGSHQVSVTKRYRTL